MKVFSHIGNDEKKLEDINKAIQSTVTVAQNEWKYLAELELELDLNMPMLNCFLVELNQVILNIIINSAHAIDDGNKATDGAKGNMLISTLTEVDMMVICIRDDGMGISEQNKSKIFDPFFTTKDVGKGTGQGLALAHSVFVDKHQGTIVCESELGKGTTFTIRIPLH